MYSFAQPCPTLLQPHGMQPSRLLCPWGFPGKNTGVGCHFLLQGIFLTQESNPNFLHCRQITPAPPGKTNIQVPNKYYCQEPCQVLGTESRDVVPLLDKVKGISADQCLLSANLLPKVLWPLFHSWFTILQMRKLRTQKIEGTICGLSNFKAEIPSSSLMTKAQKEKEHTLREIYKEKHYSTVFSIQRLHVVITRYHSYLKSNSKKWYKWTYLYTDSQI